MPNAYHPDGPPPPSARHLKRGIFELPPPCVHTISTEGAKRRTKKIKTAVSELLPEALDQRKNFSAKAPPRTNETSHAANGQNVGCL